MRARRTRAAAAALVVAAALGGLSACGDDAGTDDGTLTVWTVEDVAERVEAQKRLLAAYTEATGTPTELVAVAEDQLTPVLTSAAAADDLPDLIGALSLGGVNQLYTDDLLDTAAADAIVRDLGPETFSQPALGLTRAGDRQLAVPSDGWPQLLVYRKDLFARAGLQPPTTYAAIEAAAEALDTGDTVGIVAGTAPSDSFTQQTFEQLAVANGCKLTNAAGEIALASGPCTEAARFFTGLMREHSASGNQDADTTRAAYFAGRAGMVIWSSFILDELAGLREDAVPTCPECRPDPRFLAKNSGVVVAVQGPDGAQPATFGEIVSWAVLDEASPKTRDLVGWLMEDGYEPWLAVAPEGKVPTRRGTAQDPERFLTAWRSMPAGVDSKAPLSEVYEPSVVDAVAASPESFTRWGLPEGQGPLAGAVAGQFVVPQALSAAIGSDDDPAEAMADAADEADDIAADLAP